MAGILNIGSLNCYGQTKMTINKQLQIQNYIGQYNIDILLCQETFANSETFDNCPALKNNYNKIYNNSKNEYGTLVLVKNSIDISDIAMDTEGRIICFNSGDTTFMNVYPKSGTDVESRREREIMFSTTIPNMLIHKKDNLIIGGDWNAITDNIDATHHPEAKHSPALRRLIVMLKLKDCFRMSQGRKKHYSHCYKKETINGATRIDRVNISGQMYALKLNILQ